MASVITVADWRSLSRVRRPDVVAAVLAPAFLPAWWPDVQAVVNSGQLLVHDETLGVNRAAAARWVHARTADLPASARDPFVNDVLRLIDTCCEIAQTSRVHLRLAAGPATDRCGYHVDTALPGAAAVGVVKVYAGAPTEYPSPAQITSPADFWTFLSRRERLVRERAATTDDSRIAISSAELARLDSGKLFLMDGEPARVPVGATTAFALLPLEQHWQPDPQPAWIHRSPMWSGPRLAVTVLAAPSAGNDRIRERARQVMAGPTSTSL